MEKLLIWDIDGTLIRCKGVGRKALNAAFEERFGIPSGFDNIDMAGGLDALIVGRAFAHHGLPKEDIPSFYAHYGRALAGQLDIHRPTVHVGVEQILEETTRSGRILNTVATGNCTIGAAMKLEFTGLDHYFSLGGYGSDFTRREALVADVIARANADRQTPFAPEDIYVIGDTPHDIQSGKKNLVRTVALLTGYSSKETLLANEPDILLGSLADVQAFYKAIEWTSNKQEGDS